MQQNEALEILALQALNYLASNEELLERLLIATGMDKEGLRNAATTQSGLAGILDYVLQDESILLGFCETNGVLPKDVMQALQYLQRHENTGAA